KRRGFPSSSPSKNLLKNFKASFCPFSCYSDRLLLCALGLFRLVKAKESTMMSRKSPSLWEMTAELPPRPKFTGELAMDVAIIGGGITGLTLAYLLRHSGLRICVLERHRLGAGTSGG